MDALKTEQEYKIALKRTIEVFNAYADTPEGNELDLLLLLVKNYEDIRYQIPEPKPIVMKLTVKNDG